MFKLVHPLPEKCIVACSGGVDSMSVLHWLTKNKTSKNRVKNVVYVHHNTGVFADRCLNLVSLYCATNDLSFQFFQIQGHPPKGESKENWWRNERYKCFNKAYPEGDTPIILAHQFNDCLEEYLMNVLVRGRMGTIPYRNGRCIRPFRLWEKEDIYSYAKTNKVPYEDDPSNGDTKYLRNYIRSNVIKEAFAVNRGFNKIVRRMIMGEKVCTD